MKSIRRITIVLVMLGVAACGGSSGGDGGGSSGGGGSGGGSGGGGSGGLDARPVNLTCVAPDRGPASAAIQLTRRFAALSFTQPLGMLQAPGDPTRWFVLEKGGRVRVFANDPGVSTFDADFIDLNTISAVNASSEGGLLGMAFHPDFAANRTVFLSWTEGNPMVSVVARFTSNDGGATLDGGSRGDVINVNQDFTNHNGGHLAFGPDGNLYFGLGDGGSGGDPNSRAQDTRNLLGSMLRLDVDGGTPYAIPAGASGNPFAGGALCPADHSSATSCPEIYAWGLRNPWRFSFDRATGDLWLGDVGQNAFEEIDRIERGGNYGWDCREAASNYSSPAMSCATATGLIDPVHFYDRTLGVSVTGGYVYRGTAIPGLVGSYLFADFSSGRIWRLVAGTGGGFDAEQLLDTNLSIASFGEALAGELFVVDLGGGVHEIEAAPGAPPPGPDPVPTLLSATGCFDAQDPSSPAAGLVPYDVAVPFWSDGAAKERWLAMPDGGVISVGADGDFAFPAGTVLAKHFRLGGTLVETRLYMRHPDGGWAGYTYEWNAAGTDAERVIGGKVAAKGGQDWIYPSEAECDGCHTQAAGFSLGLEVRQLNHDFSYAVTGRTANQLATLDAIGLFAVPFGDPSVHPALAAPADAGASLDAHARGYLHVNCSHCHRPGGPTPTDLDMRVATTLASSGLCQAPQAGDLGITAPLIVAPGEPDRSVLVARAGTRDANGMPPVGSGLVDAAAVTMLSDWITDLATCP